jgi:hypothetical protein
LGYFSESPVVHPSVQQTTSVLTLIG